MSTSSQYLGDLFLAVYAVIDRFSGSSPQTQAQQNIIKEISARLRRLEKQYTDLMVLNSKIQEVDPLRTETHFDPETDTLTMYMNGEPVQRIKLNRANPDVPISMAGSTATGGYVSGTSEPNDPPELVELRQRLEPMLEDFYQCAHRILKLVLQLEGAKRINARAVTLVRNKLIEHPPEGALYSFGWSTSGPRVKPMWQGELEWNDNGLAPNTEEFLNELLRCLS